MSFIKDEKSEHSRSNIMEEDDKMSIEEATVNLSYVKQELEEFEFPENQYRISLTYENIFGDSFKEKEENMDSLIGFLDDDVIMETEMGRIKLEDVKNEDGIRKIIEQSCCNRCGGNYEGYCPNCSSLSHILNNVTPNINPESDLNSTPIDILEIREIFMRRAVFALKTIPKGIILGPFEGVAPVDSTNGFEWKIQNKKLINNQNGNWMKYIQSVTNPLSRNLDIFQFDRFLYFETNREIQEGEELLVCYREEKVVLISNNEEESYLVPKIIEEFPKIFACTLCCLGFRLEQCLVEHKSKCPQGDHGNNIENFEIIQCCCCKVWLENWEHLQGHMLYCLDNYEKSRRSLQHFQPVKMEDVSEIHRNDEISTPIDSARDLTESGITQSKRLYGISVKTHLKRCNKKNVVTLHSSRKEMKCSKYSYQTNYKYNSICHLDTYNGVESFECNVCKKKFTQEENLKRHIEDQHSSTVEKEYKCCECSYQTNRKNDLYRHTFTHTDIKPFECNVCKTKFTQKGSLKRHIEDQHSSTMEKEYKCSECSYKTNYKNNLKQYSITHSRIKSFECDGCEKKFTLKVNLKMHMKDKHSSTTEKEYQCSECSYQTNYKYKLKQHGITHSGIKSFECGVCKKKFAVKHSLKMHIKNQHSTTMGKEYKCSECYYQTNYKEALSRHSITHSGIKYFECDICKKKFTGKRSLKMHIKNKHSSTIEKEYKCSKCSYQTNYKTDLKKHSITHSGIKSFECDVCEKKFTLKGSMNRHIKDYHSNTKEKKYKCSECSYQTNRQSDIKRHNFTHSGITPFECDICKKKFIKKDCLETHIKDQHSSTMEKEYKCSKCSYQTNYKQYFNRHSIRHSEIKPFECSVCKKSFSAKRNLKMHIKDQHSSTMEKEHKCSECSYQTNRKDSLKKHSFTHSGINSFECGVCKKKFTEKSNLERHIKNQHSNTVETEHTLPSIIICRPVYLCIV